jgi:hypothetical protein
VAITAVGYSGCRTRIHRYEPEVEIVLVGLQDAIGGAWRAQICVSKEEGLLHARSGQHGEERRGSCLRFGRQHGCADGDFQIRAEDPAGNRPAGDLLGAALHAGETLHARLCANVDCTPENLLQFGVVGACWFPRRHREPSVGLLNIGVEDIKGNNTSQAGEVRERP